MKAKTAAYTLLELLLVALILGLVLLMSAPCLTTLKEIAAVELIGRQILGRAREAQLEAVRACGNCSLRWTSLGDSGPARFELILTRPTGEAVILAEQELLPGYLISSNFPAQTLNYTSAGTPSRGGTMTLTGPRGRRRYVIASSIGRLRLSSTN